MSIIVKGREYETYKSNDICMLFKKTCKCPGDRHIHVEPEEIIYNGIPICPECGEEYEYKYLLREIKKKVASKK